MGPAEVLVGAGCAALVGRSALGIRRALSFSNLAQDFGLGLSLVVPLAFGWGMVGLPWGRVSMPALAVVLAALFRLSRRRENPAPSESPMPPGFAGRAAMGLFGFCLLVAVAKWLRAPLWSWDHVAIWGLKARRIVQDGGLDIAFLKPKAMVAAVPGYPLGLPLAWRFLSPSTPSQDVFRLCHAFFAAGLVAAVFACARRLGASPTMSALASALLCASPLFWDTEAVGLADLPLAFMATVAVLRLLEARDDPAVSPWTAGAALGFLAWIKTEGAVLGALIVFAAVLVGPVRRRRDRASLLAAWLGWSVGALAIRRFLLPPGVEFFGGDWTGRLAARAAHPAPILGAMLADLAGPEWFGLWLYFAAAALSAFVLRRTSSRFLALAVVGQLCFYAFIYFGTYLSPLDHIATSFHRIAAALVPLALLAVVAAAAGADRAPEQHPLPAPAGGSS